MKRNQIKEVKSFRNDYYCQKSPAIIQLHIDRAGLLSGFNKYKMILPFKSNDYKFVRFLKENKVFSKFEKNRKNSNERFNSIESLKKHLAECDRQLAAYLGSAFAYGLTIEGKEFWKDLNLLWVNEIKIQVVLP